MSATCYLCPWSAYSAIMMMELMLRNMTTIKEAGKRCKKLDANDRQKVTDELKKHINSVKSKTKNMVDIINIHTSLAKVNDQDAIVIGERMVTKFKKTQVTTKIL